MGFLDIFRKKTPKVIHYDMPEPYYASEHILRNITDDGKLQIDYIEKLTGQSIKSIITPSAPISSAVFGFVAIFGCVLTIYKKRYKNLLIYLPAILTWATVLIAAPLAFSLRYVYILVLILPLGLILPILNQEHRKN